jgi:hypothetical protein
MHACAQLRRARGGPRGRLDGGSPPSAPAQWPPGGYLRGGGSAVRALRGTPGSGIELSTGAGALAPPGPLRGVRWRARPVIQREEAARGRPGARLGCRAASGSWHIAAALTEDIGEEAEKTSFFSGDTNESLRELEPLTRTRTSTRSRQHATLLGLRRPEALIQRLPRMPA